MTLQHGPQLALWPVHPQPKRDELLSSWIIRLAHGNGYKAQTFSFGYFNGDRQFWKRDVDRNPAPDVIELLSHRTGVDAYRINALSLHRYVGTVYEQLIPTSHMAWLMPLGMRASSYHRPGLMFCALCFKDDVEPYIRRNWRMGWSAVCTRHLCLLQERCPRCANFFQPHRADRTYRRRLSAQTTMATCAGCGVDLRVIDSSERATDEQTSRQQSFETAANLGHIEIAGCKDLHSLAFFSGVRSIAQLLLGDLEPSNSSMTGSPVFFEWLSVKERNELLDQVWDCLKTWPQSFINRCEKLKAPYTALASQRVTLPWWLQSVADQHLRRDFGKITKAEVLMIEKYVLLTEGKFSVARARKSTGRDISSHRPFTFQPIKAERFRALSSRIAEQIEAAVGQEKQDLQRDKVMLITARMLKLSQTRISSLQPEEIHEWLGIHAQTMPAIDACWAELDFSHLMQWYLCEVRVNYKDSSNSPWLFVFGRSRRMSESMVGNRFQKLMQSAGLTAEFPTYRHWVYCPISSD